MFTSAHQKSICLFFTALCLATTDPTLAQEPPENLRAKMLAPIVIPADGPTDAAHFRRERLEFQLQDLELYKKQTKDPLNLHRLVGEFVLNAIHFYSGQLESDSREAGRWRWLADEGELAVRMGSKDPLVMRYCGAALVSHGRKAEAHPILTKAVETYDSSGYPPEYKFPLLLAHYGTVWNFEDEKGREEALTKAVAAMPAWLYAVRNRPGWRRPAFLKFLEFKDVPGFTADHGVQIVEEYAKYPEKDEWLECMLRGWSHHAVGWKHRGGDYASKVKPEQWEKFKQCMADASREYRRAMELFPEYPEAATAMIAIAMVGEGPENERYWFDRAVAAQCDFYSAYSAMLWALEPRWHGSYEDMLKFGEQCVKTRRFDTHIPYTYVDAVASVRSGKDWPQMFDADPQLFDKLAYVLQKLGEEPSLTGKNGKRSSVQIKYLTELVCLAIKADRFDKGALLLGELGAEANAEELDKYGIRRKYDFSRMYAYSEFTDELLELRTATQPPRKYPAVNRQSLEKYRELLERSKVPEGKFYLETWVERLQYEVDFEEGKWVDLTFDQDFRQWRGLHYMFRAEKPNIAMASNMTLPDYMWLYSSGQFLGPKEVSVEIELLKALTPEAHFGLYMGHIHEIASTAPDGLMFFIDPQRNQAGCGTATQLGRLEQLSFKPRKLTVKFWGPHYFEMYVDGRSLGRQHAHESYAASDGTVGIGGPLWNSSVGDLRFSNVRLRLLGEEPPALTDDQPRRIDYYSAELKSDPDLWDNYFQRGMSYYLANRPSEALADFQAAIQHMPEHLEARAFLGELYCHTGKYAAGLELLEAVAIEAKKPTSLAHIFLAKNLSIVPEDKLRDGVRALKLAQDAKDLAADPQPAQLQALALAQGETGDFGAALKTIKTLQALKLPAAYKLESEEIEAAFKLRKSWRIKPSENFQ